MHHAMIGQCIDLVGERQAFLATQNPLLIDSLGFSSLEEAQRTFVLCSSEHDEDPHGVAEHDPRGGHELLPRISGRHRPHERYPAKLGPMVKRELSVLVLAEDLGNDAHSIVCAVAEKALFI